MLDTIPTLCPIWLDFCIRGYKYARWFSVFICIVLLPCIVVPRLACVGSTV